MHGHLGIPCSNAGASPVWRVLDGRHMPDPPLDNLLFGVSCPDSNSCVAVGYNGNSTFQGTLVETLSRGTWRVTPSPMAGSPYLIDSLDAVSCVSARTCTAVGSATNQMGTEGRTLVETLNRGTWRVSPSPNLRAALSTLSGASCTPPDGCVAVGDDGTPSFQKTLVERQIDGTWRLMPSPDAGSPYVVNYLNSVSCVSSTHCVAVGFAADATGMNSRTVIETLDGNAWRLAQSPNTSLPLNELFGIRCTTPTACVAVGDYGNTGAEKTLVETLTGDLWTITPSPNTALAIERLLLCLVPIPDVLCRGWLCHELKRHRDEDPCGDANREHLDDNPDPKHEYPP